MKTTAILTLLISLSIVSVYGQSSIQSTPEFFNLDDTLRARLHTKYGDRAGCPWLGAGYPTRQSSYSFSGYIVEDGSIDLKEGIKYEPFPNLKQIQSFSFPNSGGSEANAKAAVEVFQTTGQIIQFSKTISGSFTNMKGVIRDNALGGKSFKVDIRGHGFQESKTTTSQNTETIKISSGIDFKVGRGKMKTATIEYTQRIAYQDFTGVILIDGTLSNSHIMALDGGKWVGPVNQTCPISALLLPEERTVKVSGRLGNIQVGDYKILNEKESKIPNIEK
ncbi:MAG: hypothetical protein R2804_08565 [Cyclobacteriaceae bacterium]